VNFTESAGDWTAKRQGLPANSYSNNFRIRNLNVKAFFAKPVAPINPANQSRTKTPLILVGGVQTVFPATILHCSGHHQRHERVLDRAVGYTLFFHCDPI
jgi:hypothetical protein